MDYNDIKDHVKSECLNIASYYKWTVGFHDSSDNELFNYLKGNFEKPDLSKLKITFISTHGAKAYNKDIIIDLAVASRGSKSWVRSTLQAWC